MVAPKRFASISRPLAVCLGSINDCIRRSLHCLKACTPTGGTRITTRELGRSRGESFSVSLTVAKKLPSNILSSCPCSFDMGRTLEHVMMRSRDANSFLTRSVILVASFGSKGSNLAGITSATFFKDSFSHASLALSSVGAHRRMVRYGSFVTRRWAIANPIPASAPVITATRLSESLVWCQGVSEEDVMPRALGYPLSDSSVVTLGLPSLRRALRSLGATHTDPCLFGW
mmetsp:Transcript_21585/g.34105  ORF Transcript_21585/g.34105 Transcript_21585/m.34105 type:complete len:230 (+) Transcript_21585:356-1045(+)